MKRTETKEFKAFEAGIHAGYLFENLENIQELFEIYKKEGIEGLQKRYDDEEN